MMMFGRFRRTRAKRDEHGNTMKKPNGTYITEKYWKVHKEEDGDPGVYPSINHVYVRMAKGRQKYIKPAEELMDKWANIAKMWAKDNDWDVTDEKLVFELIAHFPNDNKKRDTHNAFKMMLDTFEGILYENDSKVLPRVMDYTKVKEGESPYFELIIYEKEKEYEVLKERYRAAS